MLSAKITYQRANFNLNVDVNLQAGKITVLLGPSGSGKTTFMRLIAGLEKPESGFIHLVNNSLYDSEKKLCLAPQMRKVGLMFQDYALFDHMSIAENIAYGVEKSKRSVVVSSWLQRVNLSHRANDLPAMLSGGERQRVALARALACEPEVLLLDEPFSALDTVIRHELRREIQSLIQGANIPVVLATHDLEEARLIAGHVAVMIDGRLVQEGEVGEVFRNPSCVGAAKALGWQNILSINNISGKTLSGDWGQLTLTDRPRAKALAIGVAGINIEIVSSNIEIASGNKKSAGIYGKVVHLVDLDKVQIIEVQLVDHTCLIIERAITLGRIIIDQRVQLLINSNNVKVFYE